MATILLVDPDTDQRAAIRRALEIRHELNIIEASGDAARTQFSTHAIDLTLIDVASAGSQEEAFYAWHREKQPRVPVILLTADDSDQDATVKALVMGAASYVPRSFIARDLLGTIDRILGLSGCHRRHARLLESLKETETTFELRDNDLALVPVLVGHLIDTADEFGVCTNGDRMHLAVALEEAITNGIVHGNLEVSSEHRGEDDARYHRLIKERRKQAPYCDRKLKVQGVFRPRNVSFTIADQGPGFDPRSLADPTRPENLDKAHGRGLFLIRAFTDEVSFNSRGNEIRIVKRCSPKH